MSQAANLSWAITLVWQAFGITAVLMALYGIDISQRIGESLAQSEPSPPLDRRLSADRNCP